MAPTHQLLLGLILLYLAECIIAVRRGAFLFWYWRRNSVRLTMAQSLPGSFRWGLFLRPPIPPFGQIHEVSFWPMSLSPTGISTARPEHFGNESEITDPVRSYEYDQLEAVGEDGSDLIINGRVWASFPSDTAVQEAAHLIRELQPETADSRAKIIRAALEQSLNETQAARTLESIRKHTQRLRIAAHVLFLVLFMAVPVMVIWTSMVRSWPIALGGVIGFWFHTMFQYWLAHRKIYPKHRKERRKGAFMLAMTPLAAVRAHDLITRHALSAFHPLVLAHRFCDQERWREFADNVLRDLAYPLHSDRVGALDSFDEHSQWFRTCLQGECQAFLERMGLDDVDATAIPTRTDASSSDYCPRCRTEYLRDRGACDDCGVSLRSLTVPAKSAGNSEGKRQVARSEHGTTISQAGPEV